MSVRSCWICSQPRRNPLKKHFDTFVYISYNGTHFNLVKQIRSSVCIMFNSMSVPRLKIVVNL